MLEPGEFWSKIPTAVPGRAWSKYQRYARSVACPLPALRRVVAVRFALITEVNYNSIP